MGRRLKILISAYACSPMRGSEPGMGWGFVEAISKHHDLWVIAEKEKFEPEIKAELERRPELRKAIRFYYIPKTRHKTLRSIWPPSYYWFYKAWQKKAYKLAKQLHEKEHFDIIHQLNMVGFREPGYLWKLNAPFVWGPIGGLEVTPWRFLPSMGLYGLLYYGGRNLLNLFHMYFLIRPRQAADKAKENIIAATSDIRDAVAQLWGYESKVICEIGVTCQEKKAWTVRKASEPLKLAWSGRHAPRKALNLLLKALVFLPDSVYWQLDILGEGRQTNTWKKLSNKLNIVDRCHFHGWLPKYDAVSIVGNAHVFVITSLSDLTSTVLLEALSQGLPVICLDHCGFSDVVTEKCGIKISLSNPAQVACDIATAIERLGHDEQYRQQLASGAIRRAQQYSWERKAEAVNDVYERAVLTYNSLKSR